MLINSTVYTKCALQKLSTKRDRSRSSSSHPTRSEKSGRTAFQVKFAQQNSSSNSHSSTDESQTDRIRPRRSNRNSRKDSKATQVGGVRISGVAEPCIHYGLF